jgi:hypothetical protein
MEKKPTKKQTNNQTQTEDLGACCKMAASGTQLAQICKLDVHNMQL